MPGDWIKMRTDLYRDPKVILMADHLMQVGSGVSRYVSQHHQRDMCVTCNVMRNATVGALVALWGVMRHEGKRVDDDLMHYGSTVHLLDAIADFPGIGEAMQAVGWVRETQEGIVFPRFFATHNVEPNQDAKEKARQRQQRHRASKRNALRDVTVTSQSNAREEKRREEYSSLSYSSLMSSSSSSIPEELQEEDFARAWNNWVAHRAEIKKPLKKTMVKSQLQMLAEKGRAAAIAMIAHTIAMGWQGLRDPDPMKKTAAGNGSLPPEDDFEEFVKRNLKGAKRD